MDRLEWKSQYDPFETSLSKHSSNNIRIFSAHSMKREQYNLLCKREFFGHVTLTRLIKIFFMWIDKKRNLSIQIIHVAYIEQGGFPVKYLFSNVARCSLLAPRKSFALLLLNAVQFFYSSKIHNRFLAVLATLLSSSVFDMFTFYIRFTHSHSHQILDYISFPWWYFCFTRTVTFG